MLVLGIESSCDDTAAAVLADGRRTLSSVVASQDLLHAPYGGVVPELASRRHLEVIVPVVEKALADAAVKLADLDGLAVTQGPGLVGSLLVGCALAKSLAYVAGKPLVGVNHLEGHIFAAEFFERLRFPLLALIVSGGHTDLVFSRGPGRYRVLGRTRDDAAGEAFDKVARMLGLGYPGGPVIDRLARDGDPAAVDFPRPHLPQTWDFSFAGLKTSVLYRLQRLGRVPLLSGILGRQELADFCASFQEAVVETLVEKTLRAAQRLGVREVVLGGGVAANSRLREVLAARGLEKGLRVVMPPPSLCTDNGAMIAQVATHKLRVARGRSFRCDPSLPFRNWADKPPKAWRRTRR